MLKDLIQLTKDFKVDVRDLKKLIIKKKAGLEEVIKLKKDYVVKLLQVIVKR